jgi:hypothetical protein
MCDQTHNCVKMLKVFKVGALITFCEVHVISVNLICYCASWSSWYLNYEVHVIALNLIVIVEVEAHDILWSSCDCREVDCLCMRWKSWCSVKFVYLISAKLIKCGCCKGGHDNCCRHNPWRLGGTSVTIFSHHYYYYFFGGARLQTTTWRTWLLSILSRLSM